MPWKHWGETDYFILPFYMDAPIFFLRKHQRSFWWKFFHQRGQGKNAPKPYCFFLIESIYLWIFKCWSGSLCMRSHVLFTAQMWKKCKSILLCAAFTASRGTQPVEVIPLWNWARKTWVEWLLKTHRYLQDGCFMGQEGRVVWQTPSLHLCFGWGHRALTQSTGQGWVRISTPDPSGLFHPSGQHWLHPWLPAGMVWFLHGCLHQHRVAALGLGCCATKIWCVGDTLAFLHPLCPSSACGDKFPLLQWQRCAERL